MDANIIKTVIGWCRLAFLLFLPIVIVGKSNAQAVFPLTSSKNGRYLTDGKNRPFLIKEISAWGLIQALSEADESDFIDSVKNKGFNTLMVSIISFDTRFAGNPPNWQGIAPFTTQWDFSTYNTAYFDHVDRFLKMAEKKGMVVLLVPSYLGYKGDGNQGWWDEILSANNSPAKSKLYGEFLGKRYKDVTNIIWEAGGDNSGVEPLFEHMNNIILGIKEFDKQHLWTGHFESAQGTNWSSGNALYAKYIDLDGLYDFTESALGGDAPQYKTELQKFGKGKLIFQLDQSYEQDIPHGPDNEDYQIIRRKNYDGLLSGCAGTSFSPGQKDNQCYTFTNWRPLMNTKGMQEMDYCFKLFDSLPWYTLEPDTTNSIITSGRGTRDSVDYVCAAKGDQWFYIAYLPTNRTITFRISGIGGDVVRVWWVNARNGEKSQAGLFERGQLQILTPPSDGDWLVIAKGLYKVE